MEIVENMETDDQGHAPETERGREIRVPALLGSMSKVSINFKNLIKFGGG